MRGYVNTLMAENVVLPKHDGYRFIRRRDGDRVRVFSRRGNDYTN
jgi:ATP-dependent DNA ligase